VTGPRQPALPPHPGLTVRIYSVNQATLERTEIRKRTALPADETPMLSMTWPPCRCPQHRGAR
jgi:hypothetical protein